MNLRDLHYLVTVAELKHFGKAAQKCCVSQPTLSMQIKKLENFLGITLIERTNKSVLITPVGQKVVDIATHILQEAEHIKEIAAQTKDPFAGELKLGTIPTLGPYILPHIVTPIVEKLPKIELLLVEGQTQIITQSLLHAELDAMLLALPVEHDQVQTEFVFEEPFYLAVSSQHPYAKRKYIVYDDLIDQDIMLLAEGHCLRDQALDICKIAGTNEKTDFRATSMETLRQMVVAKRGVTLIPKLAISSETKGIDYIPFKKHIPSRRIGLAWRKTSPRAALFHELVKIIKAAVI